MAAWTDGTRVKRGQLITTWTNLAKRILIFDIQVIRRRMAILKQLGYVTTAKASKWDTDGFVVTVCNYDLGSTDKPSEVRQKLSKNRQPFDNQTISISTTNPTTNDTFNELESKDLLFEENKTDNQSDNQSDNQIKNFRQPTNTKKVEDRKLKIHLPKTPKPPSKSGRVVSAYAEAYLVKYQVSPLINAKTNSIACKIVDALGEDHAIEVVRHYLTVSDRFIDANKHSIGVCLSRIDALSTEVKQKKLPMGGMTFGTFK